MEEKVKKIRGVVIKPRTTKTAPQPISLKGEDRERLFKEAVKKVMTTHADVLKALAKR